MRVTVTANVSCNVAASNDAHALGQELENRLVQAINALVPNLRYAQQIQSGEVTISLNIAGRRLRIQNTSTGSQDRVSVEGVEGQEGGKK